MGREPLTLRCGLQVSERGGFAPLTNMQSHEDGTLSDEELEWLLHRARGGFEWLSTCAAYVSEQGKAWQGQLGVASEAHVEGLTRLAREVRAAGALPIAQLHHGGAHATFAAGGAIAPMARSNGTRAATIVELEAVVAAYVSAAQRVEAAGFAGVELHGANGYIFTQFLSPVENRRTDRYGGGLAARALLLREAMYAVRAAVSPQLAVGVRLSPVGPERGLVLEESVQVARWLVEDGADFIHLSLSSAWGCVEGSPGGPPIARVFREALPADVPILAAGGIWTRADLERAHAAGVDLGMLGRVAIGHPDWPQRVKEEGWEPSRMPFTREALVAGGASAAFLRYAERFPGMLEGGAPAR